MEAPAQPRTRITLRKRKEMNGLPQKGIQHHVAELPYLRALLGTSKGGRPAAMLSCASRTINISALNQDLSSDALRAGRLH